MAASNPAITGSVLPMRSSPALGSAKDSSSFIPILKSLKITMLRLINARP
jgi:hypothetical protein